jgi:serine/threonine protein kinase
MQDDCVCILMEYAEGGDLHKLIRNYRDRRRHIPEGEVWRLARELSQALCCLHSRNIIHRDVKCLNVLLGKNLQVKLGDLGASRIIEAAKMQSSRVGTPLYLAPELVKQQPYDFKVDIWGMGCVLYQLCCLEAPFSGDNLLSLSHSIVNSRPKALPSNYSARLSQLVFRLLEKRPRERPTIAQVMAMIPGAHKLRIEPAPAPQDLSQADLTRSSTREEAPKLDQRPPISSRISVPSLAFIKPKTSEKPVLRRMASHNDVLLPEIREETRPATTEVRQRPGRTVLGGSKLKANVSDLSGDKLVNYAADALMVKSRYISPFRVRIDLPIKEGQRGVFRSQGTEDDKAANHEALQPLEKPSSSPNGPILPRELEERRPSTAQSNLSRDPSDNSLQMRPTTAYNPYKSPSLLLQARGGRLSSASGCSTYKKKVSVSDLHSVT